MPRAERRDAILTAVLPLLIERGAAATTREIAATAGVAEGTIFKAFTDKDDLMLAALERAVDPAPFQSAVARLDAELDFEDRLVAVTELMQRRLLDIQRLYAQIDPDGGRPAPKRFPDDPTVIAEFEAAADRVRIPPHDAARQLRALVLGLSNPFFVDEPLTAAQIVDRFLHGVGVEP